MLPYTTYMRTVPFTLPRFIQLGLLLLVGLMPFHAFLSVWLGHITGHQTLIQAWKELLLLALTVTGLALILRDRQSRQRLLTTPLLLIGGFGLVALLVTAFAHPSPTAIAFGAKTDLEFLVAFALAYAVATPAFVRQLTRLTLAAASLVIAFGLCQIYLLPPDFLVTFGYGPATVPPYLVLDPAVSSLRFGATLGGPSQLGTYLILPLALAVIVAVRRRQWHLLALPIAGLPVLIHTYSRSAWLGMLAAAVIVTLVLTPPKRRLLTLSLAALTTSLGTALAARLLKTKTNLQYYLLHSSSLWHKFRGSDYQHLISQQTGLAAVLDAPLGHGLGTAGPATFHAGTTTIIESNYLQLAYETGLIGSGLFVAIVAATTVTLARRSSRLDLAAASLAALAGVSLTALVLPAWTDSTTALTIWIAAGTTCGLTLADTNHV